MRRGLALTTIVLFLACSPEPRIEERQIIVNSPRDCPLSQDKAFAVMYAAGDFEPPDDRPAARSLFLRDVGSSLDEIPQSARSLIVDVSQEGDVDWRGLRDGIPENGPVNILVWPGGETCRLSRNVEPRNDVSIGTFGDQFLVAGGTLVDSLQVPHTFVGDLSTGIVERLAVGLTTRRNRPSITDFTIPGDDVKAALIAGGTSPETGQQLDSAEIYVSDPEKPGGIGDVAGNRIGLSEPRALHGAIRLATGETLLVGGVGPLGPLRTMEIVDPRKDRSRIDGVALLAVRRKRPTVLRLASGEIMVAGGLDQNDNPVPTIEWFSPDASRPTKRPVDLVTGRDRAFIALQSGGALAVIIPETPTADFKTVWVISAEGSLEPGVAIDPAALKAVRLFQGAESAPALWTGDRWLRWQPWFGAFEPIGTAPSVGPSTDAIVNGDPGLALWLETQTPSNPAAGGSGNMFIVGYRFATRTAYGTVPKPLLVEGPGQLAPDRLAGIAGSSIRFERENGLVMGPGASAFLTDVTFADFSLDVDVTLGPPSVVLREESGKELEVGGAGCGFTQGARGHISVRREKTTVIVRSDDGEERTCPATLTENARVSVGLRGGAGLNLSGAKNLVVVRR